jgi:phosphoribosylformylglycinamidine synthase
MNIIIINSINQSFIIQSNYKLTEQHLSFIIELLEKQLHPQPKQTNPINLAISINFYAPYPNYYTTFSTTIIQILEKISSEKISSSNDSRIFSMETNSIIRIEPIFFTPQDPLIYKKYSNLDEYIEQININITKNENNYFEPITNHSNLLTNITSINNKFTSIPNNYLENITYFDIMNWIQCNSEHSRHWVFRTPLFESQPLSQQTTLLNMIKSTLLEKDHNSLIAFCDNSSAILGEHTNLLRISSACNTYESINTLVHPTLTAETHNYPTYYHPFEGAATGVGGRIRDSLATGCGSMSLASLVGYSVNSNALLQNASDGASDYANKLGEPCIGGYLRYHSLFEKPILFSGGLGFIKNSHMFDPDDNLHTPSPGDYVIKIGPPAFKIGFGGSIQSSINNNSQDKDMTAIQRGDPYNGNKVTRFLEYLSTMDNPIIKKIHDQGAGGLGNVVTELLDGWDCLIDIEHLPSAIGLDTLECWLSEYQEQMVFIASPESFPHLKEITEREGVLIYQLGTILDSRNSKIQLKRKKGTSNTISNTIYTFNYNSLNKYEYLNQYTTKLQNIVSNLNISDTQDKPDTPNTPDTIFKDYHICPAKQSTTDAIIQECRESELERSFKFHLTNKIDRSVSGCVVQQSCIGSFSIPLANYSIIRTSPLSTGGIVSAIGENIYIGQSINLWIEKTVAELVCNLGGVPNIEFTKTKLSGNWMTYSKSEECLYVLYKGVSRLVELLKVLGFAIDGGKDSRSMMMDTPQGQIISPPTLVLTSYSHITESNIEKRVLPLLQHQESSKLFIIDILELLKKSTQSTQDLKLFFEVWKNLQYLITHNYVLAIHDGGNILDTLEEMCVASYVEIAIHKKTLEQYQNKHNCIFEHHYLIMQVPITYSHLVLPHWKHIATYKKTYYNPCFNGKLLRDIFNERNQLSLELDKSEIPYSNDLYTQQEYLYPSISTTNTIAHCISLDKFAQKGIKIAIIRDEGSNSHREMASAFMQFDGVICKDFTINELLKADTLQADLNSSASNKITEFLECNGFVFVGGFAYGDVLGSGVATALIMKMKLSHIFDKVFTDPAKFVLGVCNGCQILVEYGLFGKKVHMARNLSQKFECRWLSVNYHLPVSNFNAKLGIWVAHGEGRFVLDNGWQGLQDCQCCQNCQGCREVIFDGIEILGTYQTNEYPGNPNGSDENAIGLKRKNFNHYVIMPHPERSLFKWQAEYIPEEENTKYPGKYTPWIEFFYGLLDNIAILG